MGAKWIATLTLTGWGGGRAGGVVPVSICGTSRQPAAASAAYTLVNTDQWE